MLRVESPLALGASNDCHASCASPVHFGFYSLVLGLHFVRYRLRHATTQCGEFSYTGQPKCPSVAVLLTMATGCRSLLSQQLLVVRPSACDRLVNWTSSGCPALQCVLHRRNASPPRPTVNNVMLQTGARRVVHGNRKSEFQADDTQLCVCGSLGLSRHRWPWLSSDHRDEDQSRLHQRHLKASPLILVQCPCKMALVVPPKICHKSDTR
jgi:hypothetical protein